eukprot:TRINITY_DN12758_c0_g1_i1.p1 TRINITY_DN12758_c0_g1~~TRINITY_DN12758_c0_g1_i1.p1  ORF type:complete len:711 (-),score=162.60 TRINITY_DN12758_c0_g1_i1:82-1965(-)
MSAARLTLYVSPGFDDNATFSAYLYNQSCSGVDTAGHWQKNTSNSGDTSTANEFHFDFQGTGEGTTAKSSWTLDVYNSYLSLDTRAHSVVVNMPNGTQLACCDLVLLRRIATCPAGSSSSMTGLNGYSGTGTAQLYVDSIGNSTTVGLLSFNVASGSFADNATFQAQVYSDSCGSSSGPTVYWNNSLTSNSSDDTNRLNWYFSGSGDGTGTQSSWSEAIINRHFGVNGRAKSVVVLADNSTQALCCDLSKEDTTASFSQVNTSDYNIIAYCPRGSLVSSDSDSVVNGSAFLYAHNTGVMSMGQMDFTVSPGIPANYSFYAHVHNDTCQALPMGGPHWKFNTSILTPLSSNELWFHFSGSGSYDSAQTSWSSSVNSSTVKLDKIGKSIVIHEPNGNGTRWACCNLRYVSLFASCPAESFTMLNPSFSVTGSAEIYKADDSKSTVGSLKFAMFPGPADNAVFEAHVHNAACSAQGGSHWRQNASSTDATDANEVHFYFSGIGDGSSTKSTWTSVINNEAVVPDTRMTSVVVHGLTIQGKPKVACCDLTFAPTPSPTLSPTNSPTTMSATTTTSPPTASPTGDSAEDIQKKQAIGKITAAVVIPVILLGLAGFIYVYRKSKNPSKVVSFP